ncbi:MAG: FHA domain-containing protein [Phycisphaerae bacterium]|nr:FHA domain-containing protein [Phycisphaerae bacterium]
MKAVLVAFKRDGARVDLPVMGSSFVVGRSEECALRMPYSEVSRHHCQFSLTNGSLRVKDLGSSNGTYVNAKRIEDGVALKAGDRVRIGPVIFTVQIDGKPAKIKPVVPKRKNGAGGPVTAADVGSEKPEATASNVNDDTPDLSDGALEVIDDGEGPAIGESDLDLAALGLDENTGAEEIDGFSPESDFDFLEADDKS